MSFFAFDRCPVELIFSIFEYLSGNNILFSFFNTSSYMNNVLKYYNNYSFNCISITREKFDFIFSYIELNKIISLTLSDAELTAGQFGLFLSRYSSSFHLFTNLHSLTLDRVVINRNKYNLLIEAFKQFKNLYLLNLVQVKLDNIDDCFTTAFNQLDAHCVIKIDYCIGFNIISALDRLQYWNAVYTIDDDFYRQSWPNLRMIKLENMLYETSIDKLLYVTPQLVSLIVECEIDKYTLPDFRLVPNLRQLIFSCKNLTFDYLIVKLGLNILSKLKQLEIRSCWNIDELLLNGHQWETFLSNSFPHLSIFNFYFAFPSNMNWSLDTFRTQFWLEEKKWFVACSDYRHMGILKFFTVPRFNTTMEISSIILNTTSPSFEHLNSNVRYFSDNTLIYKSKEYDIPLGYRRYEHIEKFDFIIRDQFDSSLYLMNKFNCFFNLNSVKTVGFSVFFPRKVNFQQIFDLLDHMPNLSKVILADWPEKKSWLQVKRGNSRVSSIELPYLFNVKDGRLPSGLKQIFLRLFPAIEHVLMRINALELCYQFDKYSLPWKSLSSLQINYLFQRGIKEDQERRHNEWKEKFLNEVLPRQSRRNFTFTHIDMNLNIWFGETMNDADENEENIQADERVKEEELSKEHRNKKTVSCFQHKKCLLS